MLWRMRTALLALAPLLMVLTMTPGPASAQTLVALRAGGVVGKHVISIYHNFPRCNHRDVIFIHFSTKYFTCK